MEKPARERERKMGARMTLNPTAVAPNPRYRGAKPRERELEIERTRQGRKRGDRGRRGEKIYRIRRREERARERKIETPLRESTVPEINTPASCDHSSCHAPLLSPHIPRLSRSLSFIPFSPSASLSRSRTFSPSFSCSSPHLPLRVPRSSSLWHPS